MRNSTYRKSGTIGKGTQIEMNKEDKETGFTKAKKASERRQRTKKCSNPAKTFSRKPIEWAGLPGGNFTGSTPERFKL